MSLITAIGETLTLEGSDCSAGVSNIMTDVKYYESKIIPIGNDTDGATVLYRCAPSSSADTSGGIIYDNDKVVYARITNLHATEWCDISIETGTGDDSWLQFKIGPGGSFIIANHDDWGGDSYSSSWQRQVGTVEATGPDGVNVDVEVFIGLNA